MGRIFLIAILGLPVLGTAQESWVEIGGLAIAPGMPEKDVREAFKYVYCAENRTGNDVDYCSVGDGEPPEADGDISFEDGRVRIASRNWYVSETSESYELLLLLAEVIKKSTEGSGTCVEIESHLGASQKTTMLVFAEKVVSIETQDLGSRRFVTVKESTRINPVPPTYQVHERLDGTGRCVMIEDDWREDAKR